MSKQEMETLLNTVEWKLIGSGIYNHAYVATTPFTIDNYTCHWVEKKPYYDPTRLSNPQRALRKWRLINPQWPAYETPHGWLLPYLGPTSFFSGTSAKDFPYTPDARRAKKILEIYQKTKNLIYDGLIPSNMISYGHDNIEDDILVDVDFALEVGSQISDEYYQQDEDMAFLEKNKHRMPQTTAIIQNIRYLETRIPQEKIQHHRVTQAVSNHLQYFFINKKPISVKAYEFLLDLTEITAHHDFNLGALLPKLMLNDTFLVYQAPLTTPQLIGIVIDYYLDKISQEDEHEVINILQIMSPYQAFNLNRQNQNGFTLLHLAVIHGKQDLMKFLLENEVDVSMKSHPIFGERKFNFADMSALEMALIMEVDPEIIGLFEKKGANVDEALGNILPPDKWQAQTIPRDTLTKLRAQLHTCYANQTSLWDRNNPQLWQQIKRYPEVLTWPDQEGYTGLHHLFNQPDDGMIEDLMTWPDWHQLSRVVNLRHQHTLFDFITIQGQLTHFDRLKFLAPTETEKNKALRLAVHASKLDFCKQLIKAGAKVNHVSEHDGPLVFVAARYGFYDICKYLLYHGANPNVPWGDAKTPFDHWLGDNKTNPIEQLADTLFHISHCFQDIDSDKKTIWLDFLSRYPWFLNWPLSERGTTFLHYCFRLNQTPIIEKLLTHPLWPKLANTMNPKRKMSLFDEIASAGHLTYYDQLKPKISQKLSQALIYATFNGHTLFCERLLADGANPLVEMSNNMSCWAYWEKNYLDRGHPFKPYLDNIIWQNKKHELVNCINIEWAKYGAGSLHFFASRTPLKEMLSTLVTKIHLSNFEPQKDINEQLGEMLEQFENEALNGAATTDLPGANRDIIYLILSKLRTQLGLQTHHEAALSTKSTETTFK